MLLPFIQPPLISTAAMATRAIEITEKPQLTAGAGALISHVQRFEMEPAGHEYLFNLFRFCSDGQPVHWLRPEDFRDILKACQVLAFEIASEGWVENKRHELLDLAASLNALTQSWDRTDEESKKIES